MFALTSVASRCAIRGRLGGGTFAGAAMASRLRDATPVTSFSVVFAAALWLSACSQTAPLPSRCEAELEGLNATALDEIAFVREASGEAGFALVARSCDYFVPLSIEPIREDGRAALNRQIVDLIKAHPESRGVGTFEANCDCEYDPATGVVRARSISALRFQATSRP